MHVRSFPRIASKTHAYGRNPGRTGSPPSRGRADVGASFATCIIALRNLKLQSAARPFSHHSRGAIFRRWRKLPTIRTRREGPSRNPRAIRPSIRRRTRRGPRAPRRRGRSSQGLGEAPQTPYRSTRLGELDPDLAKALGLHGEDSDDDSALPPPESARTAARDPRRATLRGITGATATVHALETLLREGRPEFSERPWTPHRPPRPEKSEGGVRLPARARPSPWPR